MTSEEDTVLGRLRAIEADIRGGRLGDAAEALNALGSAVPSDPRLYLTGAMLARASGNASYEIISLQRALALAPKEPVVHVALVKALARGKRYVEALQAANSAVELAPEDLGLLETAVAIANAADDAEASLRYLRRAHALRPTDKRINLALASGLTKAGRYAEAEAYWRCALAESPDDAFSLIWLGVCLVELDRKVEACGVFERAERQLPGDQTLQFYAAIARGETPPTQPHWISQAIFDRHAARFDVQLVGQLKYRVPHRVAEILLTFSTGRDVSVLDLGCGTGLLGVYLGRIGGRFVGVDLSARMIEEAKRHGIYTELRQSDLLHELLRTAPDAYDFVTANDVFVYVGDLRAVITASFPVVRRGGALVFSCEEAGEAEGPLVLRRSKRYAHARSYVVALCREAGFGRCTVESLELRLEANVPVAGFIAIAEKL